MESEPLYIYEAKAKAHSQENFAIRFPNPCVIVPENMNGAKCEQLLHQLTLPSIPRNSSVYRLAKPENDPWASFRIGRDQSNDVVVNFEGVLPVHAQLKVGRDARILDLNECLKVSDIGDRLHPVTDGRHILDGKAVVALSTNPLVLIYYFMPQEFYRMLNNKLAFS
ncbi:Uncharacterised protein [uncultured archaeon]|nr:Uncharacterised protein [uncultured archaeon]